MTTNQTTFEPETPPWVDAPALAPELETLEQFADDLGGDIDDLTEKEIEEYLADRDELVS